MRPLLSKSTYMYGLQCHKRFYLHKFHRELANSEDEGTQAIFQQGTDVGILAQQLFPGAINAQGDEQWHNLVTVERTAELIPKNDVIYEAAFLYDEVICAVDILMKMENRYYAFEVKSTNDVKEQHIEDAALQYYVLSNCGIDIADFSIVHLNRDYVRIGKLDVQQLFIASSVLEKIHVKQSFISRNICDLKKVLKLRDIPAIEMSSHCNKPYDCNFSDYCLSLRPSVVDEQENLDTSIHVNREGWGNFAAGLQYPLFFFDFETVMYGIPEFNYSRPYQQIAFQYSLHKQSGPGAELFHFAFLGDGDNDPRPALIDQLICELGTEGSILVWNITFERTILNKLAIDFPEYKWPLECIIERMVDLMPPFKKNGSVYSEAFKGKYSLKVVLPVIVPELSYSELNIREGMTASFKYGQMKDLEVDARDQLRRDLLDYCHLDTLAMVKVLERIIEVG
jgi:hypothetical protein